MSDFQSYRRTIARKRHVCSQCQHAISAGERYLRVSGMFDGDFGTYRAHEACDAAASDYQSEFDIAPEDAVFLHELEPEDFAWLREKHPEAAAHLEIPQDAMP